MMRTSDKSTNFVGNNIKRLRKGSGLTLKDLSLNSGVSIASISKIENNKISGGFDTIYKIARGLGVLVTELLEDPAAQTEVVTFHRKNDNDVHLTKLYKYFPQASLKNGHLNTYFMEIKSHETPELQDWSNHEGEEIIVVLSGNIDFHLENKPSVSLSEGDSISFNCGLRHAFVSTSKKPARILSVSTRSPLR